MKLWDHQSTGIKKIRASFEAGHDAVLAVAPTASGKTWMAAEMCHSSVSKKNTVLWVVHNTELVDQAVDAFRERGIHTGIIQSTRPTDESAPLQVGTVQTLCRRQLSKFNLIIFDEAHLHAAERDKTLLARVEHEYVLGLSATPTLLGGRSLGDIYNNIVTIVQPSELIRLGILVPPDIYAPNEPDLKNVPTVHGDYDTTSLETVCSTSRLVGSVPVWYGKLARGRSAILFAVSVAHSMKCRDSLREAGFRAEHLDGKTPDRERDSLLARFKCGEIDVLCNVDILTTGFNFPALGCIICARPTQSTALFIQMIGRGLRSALGKIDCLVIDHAGNTMRHGFPHADREWTLEPARKRSKPAPKTLRTCLNCFAVYSPADACPACGVAAPREENDVQHLDGELKKVTSAPTPQQKRVEFDKLCNVAIYSHLSRYWVQDKFYKLFAHYPMVKWDEWPEKLPINPSIERDRIMRTMKNKRLPIQWAEDKLKRMGLSL